MKICHCRDNRARNAIIFIILVVLALFIYLKFIHKPHVHTEAPELSIAKDSTCTETGVAYKVCSDCGERIDTVEIPKKPHTEKTTMENEKEHTAEQDYSYEQVVTCQVCNNELSRDVIVIEHDVVTIIEDSLEPDCINGGWEDRTLHCNDCDKDIVVNERVLIDPKGHEFDWEITVDDHGAMSVNAVCTASECDHEYDPAVDTDYTYDIKLDDEQSIEPTCIKGLDVFVATIYFKGDKVATESISFETEPDSLHKLLDADDNVVDFTAFALYDEGGNAYYNISTPGIYLMYEKHEGQTDAEARALAWDANGFAMGIFKCRAEDTDAVHYVQVRVYNDLAE